MSQSPNFFATPFSQLHNCTDNSTLWHARLGHAPLSVIKQLPIAIDCTSTTHCDVCHLAKQTRLPFPL